MNSGTAASPTVSCYVMKRLTSVFIILFISCGSSSTNKDDTKLIDTNSIKHTDDNASIYEDTLRVPSNYYFLSDLTLRQVGKLILADSIQPSDNKITFDCMDSLLAKQSTTRDYYFPVFLKILDKSDGALAEAVGQYAMTYV